MNAQEGRAAVLALLSEITPEADLASMDPGADLRTELDMDSMDFLNLVEGLAQATGVDIPESDYPRVRTVDALTAYLVDRTGGQQATTADARVRPAQEHVGTGP